MPKFIKVEDDDGAHVFVNLDNVTRVVDRHARYHITTIYFIGDDRVHVKTRAQEIIDQSNK